MQDRRFRRSCTEFLESRAWNSYILDGHAAKAAVWISTLYRLQNWAELPGSKKNAITGNGGRPYQTGFPGQYAANHRLLDVPFAN